jgi:hypothetical protein
MEQVEDVPGEERSGRRRSRKARTYTSTEFANHARVLAEEFRAILRLREAFTKHGRGATLVYQRDQESIDRDRREGREADESFALTYPQFRQFIEDYVDEIKSLPDAFRAVRRRNKPKLRPESLRGIYLPVYVGDAIEVFFRKADFGPFDPRKPPHPRDNPPLKLYLPNGAAGYFMRNTLNKLFFLHIYQEQLQKDPDNASVITPSDAMRFAFGGNIQSLYRVVPGDEGPVKIINDDPTINTFLAVAMAPPSEKKPARERRGGANPPFDPNAFRMFYLQNIFSLNVWLRSDLQAGAGGAAALEQLRDQGTLDELLREHNSVSETSRAWKELLEPERRERREARKKASQARGKRGKKPATPPPPPVPLDDPGFHYTGREPPDIDMPATQ